MYNIGLPQYDIVAYSKVQYYQTNHTHDIHKTKL